MNKAIKWILIISGCLIVMVIAALLLIPKFVNVEKYKPQIEKHIAQATGRTFTVSDDLRLSLFPWASLSFSDLRLGNLPGFEEKDIVTIKSFDVRIKLLPLIFKDVQVKRFILKGLRVVLETKKDGRVNWKFDKKASGGIDKKIPEKTQKQPAAKPMEGFDLKALAVGEFSVTQGSILWLDHAKKERREISDVTLLFKDISLGRPVHLNFSARIDKMPFSLEGNIGPLAEALSMGTVHLDLHAKAFAHLNLSLKGNVEKVTSSPHFDVSLQVSPFSPRKLLTAVGKPLPLATADPKVLNLVSLNASIKGDSKSVSISDGVINMDDSKMNFSVKAGDFSKPNITFNFNLDEIDLDRYLPPPSKKKPEEKDEKTTIYQEESPKGQKPRPKPKKIDYSPMRRLVLYGSARIGKLKIKKAKIENVDFKIKGKNGIFDLNPLTMTLYQGSIKGKGSLNVQKNVPKTAIKLKAKGVQAGRLFNDVLEKDFLEGALQAQFNLNMKGDDSGLIKKTLNGKGDLLFKDGAIKGIDLAGMIRNVQVAFGLAEKGQEKPRTDFSELHAPFTIKRGLVNAPNTTLTSPLLRILAKGKADLVKESLDFRVEPKFVATIKGQGDTKTRTGVTVPVLVTGSFSSPKFRPDIEAVLKQEIEKSLPDLQKKLLDNKLTKEELKPVEKQIKDLFKGFGQ
ncbi:MAG: AsmA family protein [Deltaproteobacteria bacterium]|nr:AsmA family protein [Deltaproteobacteria bacterium]